MKNSFPNSRYASIFLLITFFLLLTSFAAAGSPEKTGRLNAELQALGKSIFEWRARMQPAFDDDVNRIERPEGWLPDWSPETLIMTRKTGERFEDELEALSRKGWTTADSIDCLLLKSVLERVKWENEVLRLPHKNPYFYVQQTMGALFEIVLVSSIDESLIITIISHCENIPVTLSHARKNLTDPARPFAETAILSLNGIEDKLNQFGESLYQFASGKQRSKLRRSIQGAASALVKYRNWLESGLDKMHFNFSPGKAAYEHFLKKVALMPFGTGELLAMGNQARDRSVVFETLEMQKNRDIKPLNMSADMDAFIRSVADKEKSIRGFLETSGLVTVPEWLKHYTIATIPEWIEPISGFGALYDMTGPSRLDENAVRYAPAPGPGLPYFFDSMVRDPRPIIVHEGVPGHYFQLALSWTHPDPIRRFYIDSGPNEGIGFYVEEMLLQAGLFDDSPPVREVLYNFMRLRALRVEVDVRLALGDFTLEDAANYLAERVPMTPEDGMDEARFFAATPGQAMTYQIGKLQILKYLSDSRRINGKSFDLKAFHDRLIMEGNVPIALQRWESLGLRDELDRIVE